MTAKQARSDESPSQVGGGGGAGGGSGGGGGGGGGGDGSRSRRRGSKSGRGGGSGKRKSSGDEDIELRDEVVSKVKAGLKPFYLAGRISSKDRPPVAQKPRRAPPSHPPPTLPALTAGRLQIPRKEDIEEGAREGVGPLERADAAQDTQVRRGHLPKIVCVSARGGRGGGGLTRKGEAASSAAWSGARASLMDMVMCSGCRLEDRVLGASCEVFAERPVVDCRIHFLLQ